jgi:hypothetical protein
MNRQKIAVVLIGTAVIVGIVFIRLRTGRQAAPAPAAALEEVAGQIAPADAAATPAVSEDIARVSIPAVGWGRNPFLTLEELHALSTPPGREPAVAAEVEQAAAPPALPEHPLTAIVANQGSSAAVIGTRVVRVGDRLGAETVREIKTRSVVLESEGGTREISLSSSGYEMPPAVRRGEPQ